MYNEETAKKIEKIASDSLDTTQTKIDQLNEMGSAIRNKSAEQLIGWQSWLGNISFALSGILGAVLIGKDAISTYYSLSFILFLGTGIWITLVHKNLFERSSIIGSSQVDEFRILYDDKKKVAFDLYMEPSSILKHIEFLKAELKITKLGEKAEKELLKTVENDKTSYHNDLWLAALVSAILFMVQPIAKNSYSHLDIFHDYFSYIFWITWGIALLVIWKYVALSSKESISDSKKSKINKIKRQLKHSRAYSKRIKSEIESLQKNT